MSVRVMKLVWDSSISPPTNKLAVLALADWCNDEGGSLHPSLQSIANKIGVTRGQAQRIIRSLIDQHLLSVEANRFGGPPGTTPHYRLHLDRIAELRRTDSVSAARTESIDAAPTGSTGAAGHVDATGSMDARDGQHGRSGRAAPMPRTGSTHAALTTMNHHRTINEPEREHASRAAPAAPAPALPAVSSAAKKAAKKTTRTAGSRNCPADFEITPAMRAWADQKVPGVDIDAETEKFRDHTFAKPVTDWAGAWRNWMRRAPEFGAATARSGNGADHSPAAPAERPWDYDMGTIKATGAELGIPYSPEDACEPFPHYTDKVKRAREREQAGEARPRT